MATRLDYKVSATPIVLHSAGEGQADIHSIATDVGKTIGGAGTIVVDWTDTLPATFPTYVSIDTTAAGLVLNSDSGSNDFIWIKNTGHLFDSATALGATSTSTCEVKLGTGGPVICILSPGAGILIPSPGSTYEAANDYYLKSSSDTIAIEWLVGT